MNGGTVSRTVRIPRARYAGLVARVNLENAARRQHEADRWAYVAATYGRTGERLPRIWRTDLRTAVASDLAGMVL